MSDPYPSAPTDVNCACVGTNIAPLGRRHCFTFMGYNARNCGPTRLKLRSFGNNSKRFTESTFAKNNNSQSETQRRRDSSFATELRLTSHPAN
jgi:hypothetical protein